MRFKLIGYLVVSITLLIGCTKIPELGSIAPDIRYKSKKQFAISGLQQNIGEFQSSTSTLPLQFEIAEIREATGKSIDNLFEKIPILQFQEDIVGGESEEELLLKSKTVMETVLKINPNTGYIEILEGNSIPEGEYHFDIRVSNTSGSVVLEDAMVIEFKDFELADWSRGMAEEPIIERIGDSPHQILFKGYIDGAPLPGGRIDFTKNRHTAFKGTFINDTKEGELWSVKFPVKESNSYCTWQLFETNDQGEEQISYTTENFNFILGRPGNYIIKLFK